MTPQFLLSILIILCSSHLTSSIRRASDNASPIGAYLVAVRRPDGLLGVDEPEALEQWHTRLLEQVCNTSDPATSQRFPTAESRLIYSYSHVVSGFSAWLTPQEVEKLAMYSWFVEAVPDKSYKLMSVDTPPKPQLSGLDHVRDDVWSKGNMGEGMIIGILDGAGADAGRVPFVPEPEGMPPPPAKWKGRCDDNQTCNKSLIGVRSFVDTSSSHGTDMSGDAGGSVQHASALGIDYATAFAVAPKAHLALYHVCNDERGCDPKAVMAGMNAAVDDGVDVVSLFVGNDDNTVFQDDDAVTVPSYRAVARGVSVCTPAGSSGPDMYRVESNGPWLLAVAASDTDVRVVTNVELGNGILKPDVSAPGLSTFAAPPHGEDVEESDEQLAAAASMAAAHVSGVAAMIKKAHSDWSPAAIKSALVTTAHPLGPADALTGGGASYFVTGAGEVDAAKAMDPGLVYDITAEDFVPYLCGMKLSEDQIKKIAEPAKSASCAEAGVTAAKDLNYPSIMIVMDDDARQVEAKRTVTNVGEPEETYSVEAVAPGVEVVVRPSTLAFTELGQKLDFVVTVKREATTPAKAVIEGELKLVSEKHVVRSPLVVVVGETAASSVSDSNRDVASPES
ncbi:hypothetical protein EJB05_19452, partial [Eragrostis curvula]